MCFTRMSSQKVSCEERPNLAYYCALQHFLSKYKKQKGKITRCYNMGRLKQMASHQFPYKHQSINCFIWFFFLTQGLQCIYYFFHMSEKSYSLQIGWSAQLWGSEVQSFSMLGTPARLCQHQKDSTPFWYYCLLDLSLSVSLSLFSPMSFH